METNRYIKMNGEEELLYYRQTDRQTDRHCGREQDTTNTHTHTHTHKHQHTHTHTHTDTHTHPHTDTHTHTQTHTPSPSLSSPEYEWAVIGVEGLPKCITLCITPSLSSSARASQTTSPSSLILSSPLLSSPSL